MSLVLHGKLRATVCWIPDRRGEGVFQPQDAFLNTGETVSEVLRPKHL